MIYPISRWELIRGYLQKKKKNTSDLLQKNYEIRVLEGGRIGDFTVSSSIGVRAHILKRKKRREDEMNGLE